VRLKSLPWLIVGSERGLGYSIRSVDERSGITRLIYLLVCAYKARASFIHKDMRIQKHDTRSGLTAALQTVQSKWETASRSARSSSVVFLIRAWETSSSRERPVTGVYFPGVEVHGKENMMPSGTS